MTDKYNNEIACLIIKNQNLPQRRAYHYTNSLLLPTDNQLLGMIANPSKNDPNTPDEPDTRTSGDADATGINEENKIKAQKQSDRVKQRAKRKESANVIQSLVKIKEANLAASEAKLAASKLKMDKLNNEAIVRAKAEDAKTLAEYGQKNRAGKKGKVKTDEIRHHPTQKYRDGTRRGEDKPNGNQRKPIKSNLKQKERDYDDHDYIRKNGDKRSPDSHNLPPDDRAIAKILDEIEGRNKKGDKRRSSSAGGTGISTGGSR